MKVTINLILGYIFLYMIISFVVLDFDFRNWDMELRYFFAVIPLVYPLWSLIDNFLYPKHEKN